MVLGVVIKTFGYSVSAKLCACSRMLVHVLRKVICGDTRAYIYKGENHFIEMKGDVGIFLFPFIFMM